MPDMKKPASQGGAPKFDQLGGSISSAAVSRLSAAAPSADTALVALSWRNGSSLDLHLARCPLDGADRVAAKAHGSAEVALSLPQFAALLKEFSSRHIQLETANEQPVVIRGAGNKLALIVRSKWNFGSWRLNDEHLAARSGSS